MPPPPLAAISSSSRLNVAGSIDPPPFQNRYSGSCDRAGAVNALLIPWACADGATHPVRIRPTATAVLPRQPIKPASPLDPPVVRANSGSFSGVLPASRPRSNVHGLVRDLRSV